MGNSKKSAQSNNDHKLRNKCERALNTILARVSASKGCKPKHIAIAYSGGLDSSVLLKLTIDFSRANQINLYAFHINHGLSPHADEWASHAQVFCDKAGIQYRMKKIILPLKMPEGIEEAARIARYGALGELCKENGVSLLLTAHHLNDQAETVMLQMLRGAGLPGLSAMPLVHEKFKLLDQGILLGRPFLEVSRSEVRRASEAWEIDYVEDESNFNFRFKRNALRHLVLPSIETRFPTASKGLAHIARHLQAAQRLVRDLANIDIENCSSISDKSIIQISKFLSLSEERQNNLLRFWFEAHRAKTLNSARLLDLRKQISSALPTSMVVDCGEGAELRCYRGLMSLIKSSDVHNSTPVELQWRGETSIAIPEWEGTLHFEKQNFGLAEEKLKTGRLRLASRHGGEKIKLEKNRPHRTLKNLFQEKKVPVWSRARLPLIYLNEQLVFVAGLGMNTTSMDSEVGVTLSWISDD